MAGNSVNNTTVWTPQGGFGNYGSQASAAAQPFLIRNPNYDPTDPNSQEMIQDPTATAAPTAFSNSAGTTGLLNPYGLTQNNAAMGYMGAAVPKTVPTGPLDVTTSNDPVAPTGDPGAPFGFGKTNPVGDERRRLAMLAPPDQRGEQGTYDPASGMTKYGQYAMDPSGNWSDQTGNPVYWNQDLRTNANIAGSGDNGSAAYDEQRQRLINAGGQPGNYDQSQVRPFNSDTSGLGTSASTGGFPFSGAGNVQGTPEGGIAGQSGDAASRTGTPPGQAPDARTKQMLAIGWKQDANGTWQPPAGGNTGTSAGNVTYNTGATPGGVSAAAAVDPYQRGVTSSYANNSGQVQYTPTNPDQFATKDTASQIAGMYGATPYGLNLQGPGMRFSQDMQMIPGKNGGVNAGLAQGALSRYGSKPGQYGRFLVDRDVYGNYGAGQDPWASKVNAPTMAPSALPGNFAPQQPAFQGQQSYQQYQQPQQNYGGYGGGGWGGQPSYGGGIQNSYGGWQGNYGGNAGGGTGGGYGGAGRSRGGGYGQAPQGGYGGYGQAQQPNSMMQTQYGRGGYRAGSQPRYRQGQQTQNGPTY